MKSATIDRHGRRARAVRVTSTSPTTSQRAVKDCRGDRWRRDRLLRAHHVRPADQRVGGRRAGRLPPPPHGPGAATTASTTQHDDFDVRTQNMHDDERENGHAHVKAMLLSATSHAIPVVAGEPALRHVATADLLRDGRAEGPARSRSTCSASSACEDGTGRLMDAGRPSAGRPGRSASGDVAIGGDAPVSVQSMTTTKTADINATLQQIASLVAAGVDIVRVAVPHWEDAEALVAIAAKSTVPVVADIHFQWKYAMAALEAGVQGLRINPGNIKYHDKVRLIAREAKDRGVPIRIGVNAGSLEKDLLEKYGSPTPEALVESALNEARILEDEDFFDIKISVKHSNPRVMIEAYRQLAEKCDYPLHLGVTEAGPMPIGGVKSAVGHRRAARRGHRRHDPRLAHRRPGRGGQGRATRSCSRSGLRERGLDLVACPSCGRAEVDVLELTKQVNAAIERRGVHGADARGGDGLRRERARGGARGRRRHRQRQRARVHRASGRGRGEGARGRARRRGCWRRRAGWPPRSSPPARPT